MFHRHRTIHRRLHRRVHVLQPKADSVETQLAQLQHSTAVEPFGVYLDAGLKVGLQGEALGNRLPHPLAFLGI